MSHSGRVQVGIIGSWFEAEIHAEWFRILPDEAEVVAVASPTPGNAERFARRFGIPRFFTDDRQMPAEPDIEMVTIAAPNYLHAQMTIDAAAAGKHVVCEKHFGPHAEWFWDVDRVRGALELRFSVGDAELRPLRPRQGGTAGHGRGRARGDGPGAGACAHAAVRAVGGRSATSALVSRSPRPMRFQQFCRSLV